MTVSQSHTLESKRCVLRHVTKEDIPHVFSATRYTGFNDGMVWDPPAEADELLQPYLDSCDAWLSGLAYVFTIETHQKVFIGRISIRATDSDGLWNLGFWTHPEHQGQGYMTEAVERVLQFGFDELSATEIEACHASWNEASGKVLVRCGLTWREHITQGFKKRGRWVPEERLSTIKPAEQVMPPKSDRAGG